jgi:predicted TIM-barrel fold metal-dependent hydrolase
MSGTISSMNEQPSRDHFVPIPPVDAHVHLFPPHFVECRDDLIARDPWFAETFASPKARMIGEDELLQSMGRGGFSVSVAVGWPWRDQGLCREHNAYLAEVASRHPDRIAWLGIVNPSLYDAPGEIERCLDAGASGVGEVNADAQAFDWGEPAGLAYAFEVLRARDAPIMIHTSEPVGHVYPGKGTATPERLIRTLEAFPDVRFVMAHWGGGLPFYELMPEIRGITRNVVYDSAASTYLYDFSIFPVMERLVGAERILFASDYPVLAQKRFLNRVLDAGMTECSLAAVLAENARRVYGLGKGGAE